MEARAGVALGLQRCDHGSEVAGEGVGVGGDGGVQGGAAATGAAEGSEATSHGSHLVRIAMAFAARPGSLRTPPETVGALAPECW